MSYGVRFETPVEAAGPKPQPFNHLGIRSPTAQGGFLWNVPEIMGLWNRPRHGTGFPLIHDGRPSGANLDPPGHDIEDPSPRAVAWRRKRGRPDFRAPLGVLTQRSGAGRTEVT